MIIMLHESLHMRQHLSLICACGIPSLIFWWPWNCALLLFSNACGSMVFFFCLSYFLSLSLSLSEVFTLFSQPFVREHFRGRINLVGGLEHEFLWLSNWECHHPNWRTHIFSEGWLKHQPVMVLDLGCLHCGSNGEQGPGPVTCWHWIGGFVYQHDV